MWQDSAGKEKCYSFGSIDSGGCSQEASLFVIVFQGVMVRATVEWCSDRMGNFRLLERLLSAEDEPSSHRDVSILILTKI